MSETQLADSVTVTDAQVEEFFNNEGSFSEPDKQVDDPVNKAAEPEPKQPDVAKEENKDEKKVNLGALHEERQRRKEAQERNKQYEQELAEVKRQLQQYTQPKQESIAEDDDPIETMRRRQEMVEKVLLAQATQTVAQTENQKYWARVKESELAYKQEHPDFDDAVKYLADTRKEELKDLGWSDEEAAKVLADEIKWIADKAYADEVNPAERFHNLAKRRGFKSTPEAPKDTTAEDKLNIIKKGQETNRALPPASKSVKNDLTAEALADMNVDALSNIHGKTDFDAAWEKLFGKQ
jgi:hypothetical protein